MNDNIGERETHAAHCCYIHGCKYNDSNCPVINGEINQKYICEECEADMLSLIHKAAEDGSIICSYCNNPIEILNVEYTFICSNHPKEKAIVNISDIIDSGTPICPECGDDMEHFKTRVVV
ncbi:MAG: hypothetical protein ACFFG0_24440 [Candidatus Thorarchaeota archaeon]